MANQLSTWTPLSTQSSYPGVDALIASYMEGPEVYALAAKKSPYRCHPAIIAAFARCVKQDRQFDQEDQACRDAGFRACDVSLFRENGYSFYRVPVVEMVWGRRLAEEMHGHSVVRYRHGQMILGYAFHVQGYIDNPDDQSSFAIRVRSLNGVISMGPISRPGAYGTREVIWDASAADGFLEKIEQVYDEITGFPHNKEYTRSLGIREEWNQFQFAKRILTGTDPAFRLVGEVPQIEQPLPAKASP